MGEGHQGCPMNIQWEVKQLAGLPEYVTNGDMVEGDSLPQAEDGKSEWRGEISSNLRKRDSQQELLS